MDNLTHSLAGAALAAAGLRRTTPLATATLVVAANAPDVDAFVYFFRDEYYALAFRRGYTHGPLAMAMLPFVVAGDAGLGPVRAPSPRPTSRAGAAAADPATRPPRRPHAPGSGLDEHVRDPAPGALLDEVVLRRLPLHHRPVALAAPRRVDVRGAGAGRSGDRGMARSCRRRERA